MATFPLQAGVTAKELSGPPDAVKGGDYNIIVLAEEMGPEIRDQVYSLLTQEYGKDVFHWTVKEADGLQYVYAYPYTGDARNLTFRESLRTAITSSPNRWGCNRLYRHWFWLGSEFDICGNQGGSHGYADLSYYGFDNIASSYYEDMTSCAVEIYDGYNYTSYIGTVESDWATFNSTYNDKASSVWGYY